VADERGSTQAGRGGATAARRVTSVPPATEEGRNLRVSAFFRCRESAGTHPGRGAGSAAGHPHNSPHWQVECPGESWDRSGLQSYCSCRCEAHRRQPSRRSRRWREEAGNRVAGFPLFTHCRGVTGASSRPGPDRGSPCDRTLYGRTTSNGVTSAWNPLFRSRRAAQRSTPGHERCDA
jgi:hypothetical protein